MAILSGHIRSQVLGMDTDLTVVLPYDRPAEEQARPCKVFYLLHGFGEDSSAWCRFTSVERYARDYGIALVMPSVQRSFYLDLCYGLRYFTYVTEELPMLCSQMFHISPEPSDTYVAGLSMGGYGALRCALSRPERYAGVAGLSGAVNLQATLGLEEYREMDLTAELIGALGAELQIREDMDLFHLAEKAARSGRCPRIYSACGKQDFLYEMNRDYARHLDGLGLRYQFDEWDGIHEWGFWDVAIQKAFQFFLGSPDNS